MKPKVLFRIASILILLHAIGHTMGALTWKKAPDPKLQKVISAMQEIHFPFMGRQVSYGLFYDGYGISMIFVLVMVAILLWQLSSNFQRTFAFTLAVFLIALGITEFMYFFPFAAIFSLLAGICAALSLITKRT